MAKARAKSAPKAVAKPTPVPVAKPEPKAEATPTPAPVTKPEPPIAKPAPVITAHRQGPFGGGSNDHAFAAANDWALENNIDTPKIGVGYDRDSNKYEAWVTYETTE